LSRPEAAKPSVPGPGGLLDFRKEAEATLLEYYTPPSLIVDPDLHIVHFQGDISPYLAPATGQPSFHLLKMVRPALMVDLRTAIYKAGREGIAVQRDVVQFEYKGKPSAARIEVRPPGKRTGGKQNLLVVFQPEAPASVAGTSGKHSDGGAGGLARELASSREQLRILIAEHETTREEMKAANEEFLSSNEELQSTNEELETAKEELQSSNEELITVNEELQHRNTELSVLTHDLNNLLVGIDVPVLVLDAGLRVRRFTPVAGTLLNLIPGDVGRPFTHIASSLDVSDWDALFAEVIGEGRVIEREVTHRNGHRYSLRARPYKTGDDNIERVLVAILDTDLIYRARDEARRSGDFARAIIETAHEALAVVDAGFDVRTVNQSFCDLFLVSRQGIEGQPFFGSGPGQCGAPLRKRFEDRLSRGADIKDLEVDQHFPGISRRRLVLNAHRIEKTEMILIAFEDNTVLQKELEQSESTVLALLESTPQSIVAVDARGKIVLANGITEKMFGYRREELLGQSLDILVPENARTRHAAHRKAYFADMKSRPMGSGLDLEASRKDGTVFPVEIGLSPIETPAGTLSVAFVSDITQRKQLEQVTRSHAQEVQALAASLMTAQEEERRRVSRELHDQICQQLASLAMDIGGLAAGPPLPDAQSRLRALQIRVVKASEETRHIAYELHPSVLDDLGVVASLRDLCRGFSARSANVALEFTAGVLPAAVPREIASCLYRIAQETLRNISSHANAGCVSVAIALQGEAIVLTIGDDGTGFDAEAVKGQGGLGLIGMEERARLVNGKLTVASWPGRGTRVVMEVPLPSGIS